VLAARVTRTAAAMAAAMNDQKWIQPRIRGVAIEGAGVMVVTASTIRSGGGPAGSVRFVRRA